MRAIHTIVLAVTAKQANGVSRKTKAVPVKCHIYTKYTRLYIKAFGIARNNYHLPHTHTFLQTSAHTRLHTHCYTIIYHNSYNGGR